MAATRETECPCRFCEERTALPNCHANCSAYMEWRKYVIACEQKLKRMASADTYLTRRGAIAKDKRLKKRKQRQKNDG